MSREKQWRDVIAVADLEPEDVTPAQVGRREVAVYDAPDGVYVSAAFCTHIGADLRDGYFDLHLIECPLHQGCFDIRTGMPTGAPVTRPLKMFETRVHDGVVQILL